MVKKFVASLPRFEINRRCPNCNGKIATAHTVKVKCPLCNYGFNTDLRNEVIEGTCQRISHLLFDFDDVELQMRDTYFNEFDKIISRIKNDLRSVVVGEITEEKTFSNSRTCKWCGSCQRCYVCSTCGLVFEKKVKICKHCKTKYVEKECKSCGSQKTRKLHFDKYEVKDGRKVCPNCKKELLHQSFTKFQVAMKKIEEEYLVEGEIYKFFFNSGRSYNARFVKQMKGAYLVVYRDEEKKLDKKEVFMISKKEVCPICGTMELQRAEMINVRKVVLSKESRHRKND